MTSFCTLTLFASKAVLAPWDKPHHQMKPSTLSANASASCCCRQPLSLENLPIYCVLCCSPGHSAVYFSPLCFSLRYFSAVYSSGIEAFSPMDLLSVLSLRSSGSEILTPLGHALLLSLRFLRSSGIRLLSPLCFSPLFFLRSSGIETFSLMDLSPLFFLCCSGIGFLSPLCFSPSVFLRSSLPLWRPRVLATSFSTSPAVVAAS
mmetsp:Transcript_36823/g.95027  ORF Transcript_36823/g.95027 Transcript_36823/m.95027 type:complete len:205 (+) Transcript_36823:270-884(+)